jgi:hypothetical protein
MINEGEIIVSASVLTIIIFIYTFHYAITVNFENKK